ncbi:uncharacterized protein LOC107364250 [Tetranychus urticae]|uniref:Major facilitator superfamily (MFS) profile domain-containing protein n=1 Tax=Tetranychus urticae TaxID=32264 RepID=T1KGE8_TETUR|nr:uncharacterized protein LOC107364250 [Tetranychus urticae]
MGKINWKSISATLRDSQMEFFYLIFMYGLSVQSTVVTQLIEDKICLNKFGFPLNDCLADKSENKTLVLKETSIISSYRSILGKLPAICTTLFVGSWINNYPSHLKFIITMPCISSILQILIYIGNAIYFELDPKTVLIVDLFPWIFGTIRNTFMALQTYVVLTNPPEKRIIKFASIDVASLTGSIAGQYMGGWILDQKPWFPNQVHNYLGVFIISLTFKVISVLFFIFKVPTVYKVNEKRVARNPDYVKYNLPFKTQQSVESKLSFHNKGAIKEFIRKVFSLEALKKLFRTLTKPRDAGKKQALLLLVVAEIVLHIEFSFRGSVSFQFSQKAYGWSNYQYSTYHAAVRVIPAVMQLIGPRILIQRLGVSDINLGLMAIASHTAEQIITGAWLSSAGFIAATLSGAVAFLFGSAVRSILCNVVERDEIAGVFSLLSVFSSILTLGTDWVLIRLFNATLSFYPGLGFHMFAGAAIIPFSVFMWIKFKLPHLVTKNMAKRKPDNVETGGKDKQTGGVDNNGFAMTEQVTEPEQKEGEVKY